MLRTITAIDKFFSRRPFVKSLTLCLLSAGLLVLAFPRADFWFLAWFGLVPLLMALDHKRIGTVFFLGFLTGMVFYAGTIYWFIHVTLLGMILLILYLAVYFALFAIGYYYFQKSSLTIQLFLLPAIWVCLEFLKGHVFTGFGWASLGQAQYRLLPLVQMADVTGMFGVSYLVVIVNVFFKQLADGCFIKKRITFQPVLLQAKILTAIFVIVLGYGFYRLQEKTSEVRMTAAVIQVNVAQEMKWEPDAWPSIMKKYLMLTRQAALEKPDLIIWPESAFPGFIWESPELFEALKEFVAKMQIPLLLGVVMQVDETYYNSALLISKEGEVVAQHNKIHLVPFGEYIPFRKVFPFLSTIVPIGDFTPGDTYTLFPSFPQYGFAPRQTAYSVLICFEDTVPEISREFVKHGANLLINLTNDAWFQDTKAPFLHMQAAVFRAIENRKTLIRSTNTGVSCAIDRYGRVLKAVQDHHGRKTYVSGFAKTEIGLNRDWTFYTKYGDVFTYLCFGGILVAVGRRFRLHRR